MHRLANMAFFLPQTTAAEKILSRRARRKALTYPMMRENGSLNVRACAREGK